MVPVSIFRTDVTSGAVTFSNEGVAASGAATHYSKPWSSRGGHAASTSVFWTGNPTGTLTLWYSNKAQPSLADDSDWHQDTSYAPTNPAGSASKTGDTMNVAAGRWWRIKYVHTGGAGTFTGYVHIASA